MPRKDVDDVLGGKDAWVNADKTESKSFLWSHIADSNSSLVLKTSQIPQLISLESQYRVIAKAAMERKRSLIRFRSEVPMSQ